jgi:NAD(P)-dependent dehydrogenase (short-subunit alcohol dehydrogenase family)
MNTTPGRLDNKIAIITGGAGVIGGAITESFCREGATVVVSDIDKAKWNDFLASLDVPDRSKITFVEADARDDTQVENMIKQVIQDFGRIDALVSTVGGSKDALIHKMTNEEWDFVIDLNLRTTFLACRAVVPQMREQKYGKIVLISSRSYLGNIGQINYSTAKAGIIGFTSSLARELARYEVNVNCVVPGFVDNPRLALMAEKFRQMRMQMNPFGTAAQPQDVANAILFLCSDEARQITGQAVRVACW